MIKSMTGFGRAQGAFDGYNILLELKSVNHRYFEFSARVPRVYGFLEEKLKSYFQGRIARGKVECFLQLESLAEDNVLISLNHALASGYQKAFAELSEQYQLENDLTAASLARFNDIFVVRRKEADEEAVWNCVAEVAAEALETFIRMREREGLRLKADILGRLDNILDCVETVEQRSPETVREYQDKLLARMRELLADTSTDESPLLTAAATFADKIAVAEETVRLRSHIDQLRACLESGESAVGRKLDFLVQEMNREANTIGSKAQDIPIANYVITIKSEIEKIREQVQNIE